VKRGEIWWARLPMPAGRRPVVLVSRDSAYTVRASVTVIEVSTSIRGIPTEIPLGKRDGLPKRCAANADSIVTIPKTWLESRISSLDAEKSHALNAALRFALALQ
jgi:mRNA interferase MazF